MTIHSKLKSTEILLKMCHSSNHKHRLTRRYPPPTARNRAARPAGSSASVLTDYIDLFASTPFNEDNMAFWFSLKIKKNRITFMAQSINYNGSNDDIRH